MVYSRNFKIFTIILASIFSCSMAAGTKSGKVRYSVGVNTLIHENNKEVKIITGSKVKEKDKIRTGNEAQVVVALPDGSAIAIEENSLVEFSNLNSENGNQEVVTTVNHGKVRFDAQKQRGKSTMQFKTGTATAAIRGTDGSIGLTQKNKAVFGLNTGSMDLEDKCGARGSIVGGEMMVIDLEKGCSFKKFKSRHAGDGEILDEVMKLMDEENNLDSLQRMLDELDKTMNDLAKKLEEQMGCEAAQVPDTIATNTLKINVNCKTAPKQVFINGEKAATNQQSFEFSLDWAPNAIGAKKFSIECVDTVSIVETAKKLNIDPSIIPDSLRNLGIQANCSEVSTYYYNAKVDSTNKANIAAIEKAIADSIAKAEEEARKADSIAKIPNSMELIVNPKDMNSSGSVVVGGTITSKVVEQPKNLKVDIAVGNVVTNLTLPPTETSFTAALPVSDSKHNWDAQYAQVTITYPDGNVESKNIPLEISKSSPAINTKKATVSFANASSTNSCESNFSISDNDGDQGIATLYFNGDPYKEYAVQGNSKIHFTAPFGQNTAKVEFVDMAGNKSSARTNLACYEKNFNAKVTIDGKSGSSREQLRPPPPPKGMARVIYRNIQISIDGLPRNDYSIIKSISVTQSGKSGYLLNLNNSKSIDRLDYDINDFALEFGTKTTIKVTVKLRNGMILESSKTYEVNQ